MPPDRTIVLPPSPPPSDEKLSPAVAAVVRLLRSHRDGTLRSGPWIKLRLLLTEYRKVWELLEKDNGLGGYVEDKVRYDFNPDNEEFIIRVPAPTHEDIASGQGPDAEIAEDVEFQRSTDIALADRPGGLVDNSDWGLKINAKYPQRSPDAAYGPTTALYPTVVLEVSYSQKRRDLRYIADDYIINSGGSIGVVISLDVGYRKRSSERTSSKIATVSMWRRKSWIGEDGVRLLKAEEVISEDVFRTANGEAAPGALTLMLSDFAPPNTVSPSGQSVPISIPCSRLVAYLNRSERRQALKDNRRGLKFLKTGQELQNTIGLKRKISSVEEFDSADDAARAARTRGEGVVTKDCQDIITN
ncbi:MAG: hypothetical protein M1813_003274 [Trichoglossum hirsutum]|nr:MAG: hypothetical protein M1813_003274 [Trichoglossum hirsutum]